MTPFPAILTIARDLIESLMPITAGKVGGDLAYDGGDLYVWVGLIDGSANQLEGEWIVDIDFFGRNYLETMNRALALEALLLAGPHRAAGLTVDSIEQNSTPRERPWGGETEYRIGATYVISARRRG